MPMLYVQLKEIIKSLVTKPGIRFRIDKKGSGNSKSFVLYADWQEQQNYWLEQWTSWEAAQSDLDRLSREVTGFVVPVTPDLLS